MSPLVQHGLAAGASNANWKIWSIGRHANISSFTPMRFRSTSSSPIPSFHLTGGKETGTAAFSWAVSGTGGREGVLRLLLPWLGAGLQSPCHVLYIRGDQQASIRVRWHQAHAFPQSLPPPLPHLRIPLTCHLLTIPPSIEKIERMKKSCFGWGMVKKWDLNRDKL